VMAHEIGHIKGGHLIAGRKAQERASYQSILGTVLGVGAAILGADGRAVGALSTGGAGLGIQGYFGHSRTQESAADQAALTYFENAGRSPEGLVTFLQKLEGQELLPASQQSEYMRTHPLTRDRITSMQRGFERSNYSGQYAPELQAKSFDKIKAKLIAFRTPQNVIRFYPDENSSEAAQYAHAIRHYRSHDYTKALSLFDTLIGQHPTNPFYKEMKAQTLRDSGDLKNASIFYQKALNQMSFDAPQVKIALAHVLIEQGEDMIKARKLLKQAISIERRDSQAYRLLATIEGRQDKEALARYYLAEEAALKGQRAEAVKLVGYALDRKSELGKAMQVKAQDLKSYLDGLPDKDD
jgi:predicted Zn-dependent protease